MDIPKINTEKIKKKIKIPNKRSAKKTEQPDSDLRCKMPNIEDGYIPEARIRDKLGMPLAQMRRIRNSMPDDWIKKSGNSYLYSADAIKRISMMAGIPHDFLVCEISITVDWVVVKQVPKNKKLIIAEDDDGDLVRVKVRDNSNFLPGMIARIRDRANDTAHLDSRLPTKRSPKLGIAWRKR